MGFLPPKRRGESPEGRSGGESESRAGGGAGKEGASQECLRGGGGKAPLSQAGAPEGPGWVGGWGCRGLGAGEAETFLLRRRKPKGLSGGRAPGRGGGRAVQGSGRRGVLGEEGEGKGRGKPERPREERRSIPRSRAARPTSGPGVVSPRGGCGSVRGCPAFSA